VVAIVLIGFQKSGKTSLGKYLAKASKQTFIDLDEHILQQTPYSSIREAFIYLGEKDFREHERQSLQYAQKQQIQIIATGGGTVTTRSNRELIINMGTILYLKWDFSILRNRIQNPAYTGTESLDHCFKIRSHLYERLASRVIKLDNTSTLASTGSLILKDHRLEGPKH
jgi:shikimate kinase